MNKNLKIQNEVISAKVECYRLLKECVSFDNIEDRESICKNNNLIEDYCSKLCDEMYLHIEHFVNETIKPIVYDVDYFSFLKREDFGSYNDAGHFVINFDCLLEMLIFRVRAHT